MATPVQAIAIAIALYDISYLDNPSPEQYYLREPAKPQIKSSTLEWHNHGGKPSHPLSSLRSKTLSSFIILTSPLLEIQS